MSQNLENKQKSSLSIKHDSVESFLSGKLSSVDVRKIESELKLLWSQASGGSDTEEHPQVIRACSGNLILYTDRDDAETADADMLDDIILAHPSRAILAINRRSTSGRKLEAWVSARCHLAPGSGTKQICSEQITVLAEGEIDNELVSVIDSLLLGDLPSFLWWTVGDLSGERLAPFLSAVERVIVDSSRAPYSFSFLRDLQQLVDSTDGCISISDLNWRRLLGVRAAVADELERAPFSLKTLDRIAKVKVSSCGQEFQEDRCSIQAIYFVSWLAAQLGWIPVSLGRIPEPIRASSSTETQTNTNAAVDSKTLSGDEVDAQSKTDSSEVLARFRCRSQSIDVRFCSEVLSNVPPGSIYEIEIELDNTVKMRVSRDPAGTAGSLVVVVSENGIRLREVIADDSDMDRVRLMGRELENIGSDPVFVKTLALANELLALLETTR